MLAIGHIKRPALCADVFDHAQLPKEPQFVLNRSGGRVGAPGNLTQMQRSPLVDCFMQDLQDGGTDSPQQEIEGGIHCDIVPNFSTFVNIVSTRSCGVPSG